MTRAAIGAAVAGLVLLLAFTGLGLLVADHPLGVDAAIADGLNGQWQRPIGRVAGVLSDILGPVLPFVAGAALLIGAVLRQRQGDRSSASVLARIALVLLVVRLVSVLAKPVFDRVRPRDYPDFSYPSGHVASVASTGFAVVLTCLWLAPRLLRRVLVVAVALTVLCAGCRIGLGVHWLTDTIGSVLVVTGSGLLLTALLGLFPAPSRPVTTAGEAA